MRDFEVVVVVDGSTDGTADALRTMATSFPLIVIEQPNQGRAAACNAGASAARGAVLLFMDDDMEADPRLLAAHQNSREDGGEVVFGHLAVHPESPPGLFSAGLTLWADGRLARLTAPGARFGMDDYLTGQMSVDRSTFDAVGRFDTTFTRSGLFGGEDIDLCHRLVEAGHRIVFNPAAITYQLFAIDPKDHLRRAEQTGRSQQELIYKHPERADELGVLLRYKSLSRRVLVGSLSLAPRATTWPIRVLATALVRRGRTGYVTRRLYSAVFGAEYRRGARRVRRRWRKGRSTCWPTTRSPT